MPIEDDLIGDYENKNPHAENSQPDPLGIPGRQRALQQAAMRMGMIENGDEVELPGLTINHDALARAATKRATAPEPMDIMIR